MASTTFTFNEDLNTVTLNSLATTIRECKRTDCNFDMLLETENNDLESWLALTVWYTPSNKDKIIRFIENTYDVYRRLTPEEEFEEFKKDVSPAKNGYVNIIAIHCNGWWDEDDWYENIEIKKEILDNYLAPHEDEDDADYWGQILGDEIYQKSLDGESIYKALYNDNIIYEC